MKVYVSELPKSCEECPMCRSGKLKLQRKGRYVEAEQCVFGQYKYQTIDNEIDTCPLKPLSDYTKQVRKEIVQEIWKEFEQRLMNKTQDMPIMKVANMINSVLDQIQGDKND